MPSSLSLLCKCVFNCYLKQVKPAQSLISSGSSYWEC